MENVRFAFEWGYIVLETPGWKAYPFLGFGYSILSVDSLSRVFLINANGGAGVDYFVPHTPVLLTVQAVYTHSFNIRAADGTAANQPGFGVRAHISIYLYDKKSIWGFE